jgi:hypothetical protein
MSDWIKGAKVGWGAAARPESRAAMALQSLPAGLAWTFAPSAMRRRYGIDTPAAVLRGVGVANLVLAAGLYRGRPRWPWVAGRAVAGVVQEGLLLRGRSRWRWFTVVPLALATVTDLRKAAALRAAGE